MVDTTMHVPRSWSHTALTTNIVRYNKTQCVKASNPRGITTLRFRSHNATLRDKLYESYHKHTKETYVLSMSDVEAHRIAMFPVH